MSEVIEHLKQLKTQYMESTKQLAADEATLKGLLKRQSEIEAKLKKMGIDPKQIDSKIAECQTQLEGLMKKIAYLIDPSGQPNPDLAITASDPAPTIDITEEDPDSDDYFPSIPMDEVPI